MSSKKRAYGAERAPRANLMYLGPTIIGVIRHSTIFKGGALPEKAKECVKQFPMMKKLFIPIEELPQAVKELSKEQSALGTIYSQTAKKFIK